MHHFRTRLQLELEAEVGRQKVLKEFQEQRNQQYAQAKEDLKLQIMDDETREASEQKLWEEHDARSHKPKVLAAAQERLARMSDPKWADKRRGGLGETPVFSPHWSQGQTWAEDVAPVRQI